MRIHVLLAAAVVSSTLSAQLVTDINKVGVPRSSDPSGSSTPFESFVEIGGKYLFAATDDQVGRELWSYDVATGKASLLKDILPGSQGSTPFAFHKHGGRVYFGARDATHGIELWSTDGTSAGTQLVHDLEPGAGSSLLLSSRIASCGTRIVFDGRSRGSGLELCVSDGTAAGTQVLRDIRTGPQNSFPKNFFTSADGKTTYFTADDGTHGAEPWITDGTSAGTRMVADLEVGAAASTPKHWFALGSRTLISSHGGWRLWVTNGQASGTTLLSSSLHDLTHAAPLGSLVCFAGVGAGGNELWRTDGTPGGTKLLVDIEVGARSSHPRAFLSESGTSFLFLTTPNFRDFQLRRATPSGVTLIKDLPATLMHAQIVRAGQQYYLADTKTGAAALWTSDGTTAGTRKLSPAASWSFGQMAQLSGLSNGGALVVALEASVGRELFHTSSAGVDLVANIQLPKVTKSSSPTSITELGRGLVLSADDGVHGRELWVHDGSDAGSATLLADLEPGALGSDPRDLVLFGARVFFSARTTAHGRELFMTDGTTSGTRLVRDVVPGAASSDVGSLRVVGRHLYFAATTTAAGRELWISDGTTAGTRLFADVVPGAVGSSPSSMTSLGGSEAFVFAAQTAAHGRELWSCDGRASSVREIKDIAPGATSGIVSEQFVAHDGQVFFLARPTGYETIWSTDGTSGNSRSRVDLAQVARPRSLTPHAGKLYFIANWVAFIYPAIYAFDGSSATLVHLSTGVTILTSQGSENLLFDDRDASNSNLRALWSLDTATRTTAQIARLPGKVGGQFLRNERAGGENYFASGRSSFYFTSEDETHGREVWRLAVKEMTTSYGAPCSTSGGAPALRVENAVRGQTLRAFGTSARMGEVHVLLIGAQAMPSLAYAPGCHLYVDLAAPVILDPFVSSTASWVRSFQVPQAPGLAGASLTWQALALPSGGLRSSNAVRQLVR